MYIYSLLEQSKTGAKGKQFYFGQLINSTAVDAMKTGNTNKHKRMRQGFSLMDWNNLAQAADLAHGQYSTTRKLTMEEVRLRKDWCVIRGKVYDYTKYTPYHPGGSDELERAAGDDCTALFDEFHPWVNAEGMLRKCQVGVLVDPEFVWTKAVLVSREDIGGHFYRIRLSINQDEKVIKELEQAKEKNVLFHIKVRTKMGTAKRILERPYTPLIGTDFDEENSGDVVSLLVKRSLRKDRSCFTHALCAADESVAKSFQYEIQLKPCLLIKDEWYRKASAIGMVCAGSGITPAMQLLSREAHSPDSDKRLFLVWCNRDEKHIALQPELHRLMVSMKGRLTVIHLFSRCKEINSSTFNVLDERESYEFGRFDEEFLANRPDALPQASKTDNIYESSILICGPWDFEKSVRATMFMSGFSTEALIRIPG